VNLGVVIPALDAARTIEGVVRGVRDSLGVGIPLVVVDDGSMDDTATIARAAGAEVVAHERNYGKGRALRTGMRALFDRGCDAALTIDADGQHPIDEAVRIARASAPKDAVVLSVRDLVAAGAPRPNRISNAISNGFLSFFARKLLADTQCGLRRYPLPRTLELGGRDDGYAFEAEIILLAIAANVPIVEVPVRVLYPEDRITHFDSVRDPIRVVARVVKTLVATRYITRAATSERLVRSAASYQGDVKSL
jgi:glycosyltransferase involved in cell wall biosynthesis